MSKLRLDRIDSSFGFQTAFNNVLSRIEEEFSDKVLYRDNPIGEANNMHNDLDMSGNDILNAGTLSANNIRISGQGLDEFVSRLETIVDEAEADIESLVGEAGTSLEGLVDEAEGWADQAAFNANTVAYNKHEGVLLEGESVMSLPWPYNTDVGVEVFLEGIKQPFSSLIFTSSTSVALSTPVSEDTNYEVVSSSRAASELGTQLADPSGSTLVGYNSGTVKDGLDARPTSTTLVASGGSTLVGFLQDGTGAIARTVQDRMREHASVFDFLSTAQIADVQARTALIDCTEGLQTALGRMRGAGQGKSLYFPSGTYLISGLTTYYDSTIVFHPAAMLKMSGNGIALKTRYGTSDTYVTNNIRRVTLENVQIDMDNHLGFGLLLEGVTHARVINPRVLNVGSGTYSYNDGVATDPYNSAGIMLKGVHGVRGSYYNRIINPRIESTTAIENNGIYLGTTASQSEQRANFNHIEQPVCQRLENGISVNLGGDNIITQPELSLCGVGIRVGRAGGSTISRRTRIILPYLESCTTAGILLSENSLDTTIDGIASTSFTTTPVSDSGVNTSIYAANSDSLTPGGHARFYENSIRFPAAVADTDKDTNVNALDDYQEGTFIPVIEGLTSAGEGTYSVQTGNYTLIGNRCFFNLYLIWSAHTGTGNMRITGLPFKAESGNNLSPISFFLNGITMTADHLLQGYVTSNQTRIELFSYAVGTGVAGNVPIDAAGTLAISGQYLVNH